MIQILIRVYIHLLNYSIRFLFYSIYSLQFYTSSTPLLAHVSIDCNSGGPDSPNSPPTRGSPTSAPIQEENEDPQYNGANRDLQLFSSPSMPNISLGRPHLSNVAAAAANHFVSS